MCSWIGFQMRQAEPKYNEGDSTMRGREKRMPHTSAALSHYSPHFAEM